MKGNSSMEESVITRIMPNSLEAEQSVVGSMIMDRQAIITAGEMLNEDDFYHRLYGIFLIQFQPPPTSYNIQEL